MNPTALVPLTESSQDPWYVCTHPSRKSFGSVVAQSPRPLWSRSRASRSGPALQAEGHCTERGDLHVPSGSGDSVIGDTG